MVKNTGGNKAKGFARKNMVKTSHSLRVLQETGEIYAQAVKILGGAMCRVVDLAGVEMNCHIRGKFRGRGKRDNTIVSGTWLLVGLREWEREPMKGKLLNCDLIEVYSDGDKSRLKNSVTSVDWTPFVVNDSRTVCDLDATSEDFDIEFTDDKTEEYKALIEAHVSSGKSAVISTEGDDDDEEINIDDI